MCVTWTGKWRKTTRSMVAWKLVSSLHPPYYQSPYGFRTPQSNKEGPNESPNTDDPALVGKKLTYKLGVEQRSRRPGIYLYRQAIKLGDFGYAALDYRVLKVRIPAGTLIRYGVGGYGKQVNATCIIPIEEA